MSGRFVAAITTMSLRSCKPSSSVSRVFTTRSETRDVSSMPRTGASASSSSRKTTTGATCRAFLKTLLTARSDSPTHLLISSGPRTLMKFASVSLATALTMRVLPVPGGPKSKIPRGGLMPILLNDRASFRGHSIASISSWRASSSPPTSFQVVSGISMRISRRALGCISRNASLKSSSVIFILVRVSAGISLSRSISGMYLLKARIAASFVSERRSAPTKPWVMLASASSLTSLASGMSRV